MTQIVATIVHCRKVLAERHLPYKVVVPALSARPNDREGGAATVPEMKRWCREQIGPMAWGQILNPEEAEMPALRGKGFMMPYVAKVTFDTEGLWCKASMTAFRFKDEVHAAAFKLAWG